MAMIEPSAALEQIGEQQKRNGLYRSMIDGSFALPFANRDSDRYVEFKRLLEWARIDIASVIVETTAERLTIEGFRTDPRSLEGDSRVWELWDRVGGPLTSQLSIIDSLSVGDSFLLVERDEDGEVTLSGETSDTLTVFYEPGSRTKISAVVKVWKGVTDEGEPATYMTAYDATSIKRWRRLGEYDGGGMWEPYGKEETNPFGFVPVSHVRNRPSLAKRFGRSELWGLENDIGRVNKLSADLMLISEFSSFKVRYATGIEDETDASGNPVAPFNIGPDRLLTSENDQARFGSLEETPLDGHLQAVKTMLTQVAALSRTPMFYLSGDLVNVSADGLRAMDGQLVSKALQRQLELQGAFVDGVRLMLRAAGEADLAAGPLEVMWRNPEKRSYSEVADSVFKLTTGDNPVLPVEQARIELGYGPVEREQMKAYAAQDAARRRMAAQTSGVLANVGNRLRQAQGDQPQQEQTA